MDSLKVDPYLINGQHRITVLVVGAGGTGGKVLTKLIALHEALTRMDHPGLYVTMVDPDIVEDHNVGRQSNFSAADVGYYKADALISKVNAAFGYDWDCENVPYSNAHAANIVFSCVDNAEARAKILDAFFKRQQMYDTRKGFYIFDCGNARDYGQVILTDQKHTLKHIGDIVPDWDKQDTVEQQGESCSYAESLRKQDLFINDWVALYAVNLFKELLFKKEIDYQGVFFNTADFDAVKIKINNGSKKRRKTRNKLVDRKN